MIRFSPKKLREFNKQLFAEPTFDAFLVPEAHFVTAFRTDFIGNSAEGSSNPEDGLSAKEAACVSWKELRPIALQLVRGQAPKSFSVVLKLPEEQVREILAQASPDEDGSNVEGFYLNIRYAKDELMLTSGCMQKTFSLDKTWEKAWDHYIENYLSRLGLI